MEDGKIVELYWARSESAITETNVKYGRYCFKIAFGILQNREDAEETVNDTWMHAWDCIPPHRPAILSTFLGKITRRLSLNRWRDRHAEKRGKGEVPLVLEELQECVSGGGTVEEVVELKELTGIIEGFLGSLPETERNVFIRRYWNLESIRQIGEAFGFSDSKVKTMLWRMREKLEKVLAQGGVQL